MQVGGALSRNLQGFTAYIYVPTVVLTVLSHTHRVSKREEEELEYKRNVYQLAREHEKVRE